MNFTEDQMKKLNRLQDLIGKAKSLYENDLATNRADKILPIFDEDFNIILDLRCDE